MFEFLGLFAEMFSFAEIIGFIWLYVFSKNYRKKFREKWNEQKVGIERESRTVLMTGIFFSILLNAIIIFGIVYAAFFV